MNNLAMKKFNYIYLIRNLINNKIYIGKHSTDNLNDGYFGSGKLLKKSIKKYGKENFRKELLCMCVNEEELNEMEIYYIEKFNSTDKTIGYNLTKGGDGCVPTEETRKKKSASMKGKHWNLSEETKSKMADTKKGKTSPNKGRTFSDETKKKMSESMKGENNPNFGKHLSEETKQKMSESHKGKNKGKPLKKCKWITTTGEIIEMAISHVKQWHPDWILYEE